MFWLSNEKVATVSFKRLRREPGGGREIEFTSAIFGTDGKKLRVHQWQSTPGDSFFLDGGVGFFAVESNALIRVFSSDFTQTVQIPHSERNSLVISKNGEWLGVKEKTSFSTYEPGQAKPTATFDLAEDAWPADFLQDALLLTIRGKDSCLTTVHFNQSQAWNVVMATAPSNNAAYCPSADGLLSGAAVFITSPGGGSPVKLARREGTIESTGQKGHLLGVSTAGRIALSELIPSELALSLDMDFGGHKVITVYDTNSKTVVFRKTIGGQGGASFAPDGHHLAIVDGSTLTIYPLL